MTAPDPGAEFSATRFAHARRCIACRLLPAIEQLVRQSATGERPAARQSRASQFYRLCNLASAHFNAHYAAAARPLDRWPAAVHRTCDAIDVSVSTRHQQRQAKGPTTYSSSSVILPRERRRTQPPHARACRVKIFHQSISNERRFSFLEDARVSRAGPLGYKKIFAARSVLLLIKPSESEPRARLLRLPVIRRAAV